MKKWPLGVAIALVGGVAFWLYPGRPVLKAEGALAVEKTAAWLGAIDKLAEPGYWLVVRGTHPGDQAVAAVTAGRLSHAAVLDKDRKEVIEALAHGVQVTPLEKFLADTHRLIVMKPRDYSREAGRFAVQKARSRVGKPYDWLGLVGAGSSERFYCTELAVDCYGGRQRGWPLHHVIKPEEMPALGSVLFDEVRN